MGVIRRLLLLKKKLLLLKLCELEEKKKRKRKLWYTLYGNNGGTKENITLRMSPDKFDFLHRLVMNDLIRQFLCREPLCSEERLAITIRYISSGMAIKQVAMVFEWHLRLVDWSFMRLAEYCGTFSIVLMAVADDSYKFVMVDVGARSRHSDGGMFKATSFGKGLMKNCLNLPAPARLPKSNKVAPHVFVGDEAFQLRPDFMRPYHGKDCSQAKKYLTIG
ncbi:hypothetical protein HPB49_026526 [Dermacentor silvarum]|nr:hypothetical protein HPB49_026526 [Dermacentor silvarum]